MLPKCLTSIFLFSDSSVPEMHIEDLPKAVSADLEVNMAPDFLLQTKLSFV